MFMILGPNGPFCNIPPAIETHVEFISDIIKASETSKGIVPEGQIDGEFSPSPTIESTQAAEEEWTILCDDMSKGSLFRSTESWIFGSNVPGKKISVLFYFGGLSTYRKKLREIANESWRGFLIS